MTLLWIKMRARIGKRPTKQTLRIDFNREGRFA